MEQGFFEKATEFARANEEWALLLAFLVAGAESVVGLSLFVPSTAIFIALAAAGGAAGQDLVKLWLAAGFGAAAGDWISYGIGYFFRKRVRRVWPLNSRPELLVYARAYFRRWGVLSIFICRFIGPARSFIMLTAGILKMRRLTFAAASLASALLWAGAVLFPAGHTASWFAQP